MSREPNKRIMMLLSFVEGGKGKKLMEALNRKNIQMHFQSVGLGTAPTEMMDIFGLGSNSKDIIFSLAAEQTIKELMADFGHNFGYSTYGGLMIVLKLSAINRLMAEILNRDQTEETAKGAEVKMKNEHKHNLIMIAVAQGYTDQVMQTARKAGATGGTVIRGRLEEAEKLKEVVDINVEEREIIFIMAPSKVSSQIMEEVNKEFGLRTKAQAVLCMVPIEKAYKI